MLSDGTPLGGTGKKTTCLLPFIFFTMTIAMAWTRTVLNYEQLLFVSDSRIPAFAHVRSLGDGPAPFRYTCLTNYWIESSIVAADRRDVQHKCAYNAIMDFIAWILLSAVSCLNEMCAADVQGRLHSPFDPAL